MKYSIKLKFQDFCLFLHFLHFLDYHSEYFKELSLKMQMLAVKNSISRKLYVVKLSKSQIFFSALEKKSTSARKGDNPLHKYEIRFCVAM